MPHNRWPGPESCGNGGHGVRVLLATYDSRGGVEPLLGTAAAFGTDGATLAATRLVDQFSPERML